MAKSSPLLSSRAKERRKKKFLRSLIVLVALAAAVFIGLVFLSRASWLQIASFDISGTNAADDSAVRAFITGAAEGNYFYFFPRSDIFLYPAASVQAELLARFPEIKSADVGREDLHAIKAELIQKKPIAVWCGDAPGAEASRCLFLDEGGEAYKQAPQFSVSPYFEYFGTLSSGVLPATFLPKESFAKLQGLAEKLSEIFPAVSAYRTPDNDFELRTARGTVLKISEKGDYTEAFRYLKAFLSGASLGSASGNPDKFEYIDLRFGKKVYFKPRGAPVLAATSSPAVHN